MLNCLFIHMTDIPSPTRKKGSTSTSEDCVVPDIDDEDNVFNFEQPRVPAGVYFCLKCGFIMGEIILMAQSMSL